MASYTASVPEGMSYVNAWYALYVGADNRGAFFENNLDAASEEEQMVSTSEKVANLFRNYPDNSSPLYYMEYEGGKLMKVHFCDFPKLDVYYYDRNYGMGAAQEILNNYNKIPSSIRFDNNDTYKFSDLKK